MGIFRLAHPGVITQIEIDTKYFKGKCDATKKPLIIDALVIKAAGSMPQLRPDAAK